MTGNRLVGVYLGTRSPQLVGTAFFHGFGSRLRTTFSYEPNWLNSPDAFSLSPHAPLVQRSFQFSGLPGFLSDAAPDRWGRHLIFRGAQRNAIENRGALRSLDDVDYLLGVDDWSRMGALRLSVDGGSTFLGAGTDIPKLVRLPELVSAARSVDAGSDGWEQVKTLLDAGSNSLGGARPKATIDDNECLWLAKFPGSHDEWNVMAWEAWALDIAERAGLKVSQHRMEKVGKYDVLLSKRFDRAGDERAMYLSALSLLGMHDGADADYYDLADQLISFSCQPEQDFAELLGRIALSVAIHNTDDHLRNHGLLHGPRGWTLSPVFDVNPNPYGQEERALSIYGERGEGEARGMRVLAESLGVRMSEVSSIASRVILALDGWQVRARRLGCTKNERDMFAPVIQEGIEKLRSLQTLA